MNELMRKETQEAVNAGNQALRSLYAAREKLGSARNWGIYDMFGGGFISTMIKHSKMEDASGLMEQAKQNCRGKGTGAGCHRLCGTDTGTIKEAIGRRAGVGLWDVLEIFYGLCLAGLSVD